MHVFLLLSNWKHLKFHSFWLCCQIMSRITPFFGPILCRESRCIGDTFQPYKKWWVTQFFFIRSDCCIAVLLQCFVLFSKYQTWSTVSVSHRLSFGPIMKALLCYLRDRSGFCRCIDTTNLFSISCEPAFLSNVTERTHAIPRTSIQSSDTLVYHGTITTILGRWTPP